MRRASGKASAKGLAVRGSVSATLVFLVFYNGNTVIAKSMDSLKIIFGFIFPPVK
jgi:hypothetical protein